MTILPTTLVARLKAQLCAAHNFHDADRGMGYGAVYLSHGLERKYLNATTDWSWQYIFPAELRNRDHARVRTAAIISRRTACNGR